MRVWKSDGSSVASLTDALCIKKDIIKKGSKIDCCVISVIGGGGKTSLLYRLSRELAADGFRVALTTTTHMMIPQTFPWTESIDDAVHMLSKEPALIVHRVSLDLSEAPGLSKTPSLSEASSKNSDRCVGISAAEYDILRKEADIILVEADGARQLPLKAAAAHEPVIMWDSDYVIAVAGVDAMGRPLQEVCHRPQLAADYFGLPLDTAVTEEIVVNLLTDPVIGQMKGVGECRQSQSARQVRVLINKADDEKRRKSAFNICDMLSSQGIISAVSALRDRVALIVLAAGQSKRFICGEKADPKAVFKDEAIFKDVTIFGDRAVSEDGDAFESEIITAKKIEGKKRAEAAAKEKYPGDAEEKEEKYASKLEFHMGGEPIYAGLLRTVRELVSGYGYEIIHEKILVTQEARQELRKAAEADGFRIVINQQPENGISSSIKLGINAVEDSEAYLFTVCDQPKLSSRTFYRLIEAYQYGRGSIAAVRPEESGIDKKLETGTGTNLETGTGTNLDEAISKRLAERKKPAGGSPNIFSDRYRSDLLALEGDTGGKRIIRKHAEDTVYVDVPAEELFDIDTMDDLVRLTQ